MSDEDELAPAERELETALRSLHPTPARIHTVAASLAARHRTGRLRIWKIAAAAAAIAVGGGAWLASSPRRPVPNDVERNAPSIESSRIAAVELPSPPPTLIDYRRALALSLVEFEDMLDRQAMAGTAQENQFTPVVMLTPWNAGLQSSLGEM